MKIICERFGCNEKFEKIVPWSKYCSQKCKHLAWAIREVNKKKGNRNRRIDK